MLPHYENTAPQSRNLILHPLFMIGVTGAAGTN